MLDAVTFERFKSYRQARLPLAPLTLLIGANASGKSNAIEGLRLLSWLAQDHKLSSIRYEIQDSDELFRGSVNDLPYSGSKSFVLGCEVPNAETLIRQPILSVQTYLRRFPDVSKHSDLDDDPIAEMLDWLKLSIEIELADNELRIVAESITSPTTAVPLYKILQPAVPPSHDIRVAYNNFARGGRKPQITCSDQQAVFLQLQTAARFEEGHTKAQLVIPGVTSIYRKLLADILFLDPVPKVMRGYSFAGERRLRGDGRNISGVIKSLCESDGGRERLLAFVASLPEQNITGIDFATTTRGEVMLRLVETFGGRERPVDAPVLSDGTLRVLAVAAAILSAPEGSMVVIEEIDNGVHPSRAHLLLQSIREVAAERRLRVLLTTHNPALMDALPDAALGAVVFCYRDPAEGDSRLVRLADLERAPSLLAQGSLGELVTRGILDRFVKSRTTPDERKAKNRRWLEELEHAGEP